MANRIVAPAKGLRHGTVFMIHGWAQNANVLSYKSTSLTKKFTQAGYDCVFLQAPFQLPMASMLEVDGKLVEVTNGSRENAYAWFYYNKEDPGDTSRALTGETIEYVGLEESIRVVEEELANLVDENGTVSILGFSQGAVFGHVLASLAGQQIAPFHRISKCISVSGFCATPQGYSKESLSQIQVPTLHVIGSKDTSVLPTFSNDLAACFVDSQMLHHEKGHMIPQQSARCAEMIVFLNQS